MMMNSVKYFVFSGGGIKGLAFCGAVQAFFDEYTAKTGKSVQYFFTTQFKGASGTSIGSAYALACTCINEWKEFLYFMCKYDHYSLTNNSGRDENNDSGKKINIDHYMNEFQFLFDSETSKGVYSHRFLLDYIDKLLDFLHLDRNITFEEHFQLTGKVFTCNTVCLSFTNYQTLTKEEKNEATLYMNYINTPYLPIRKAICMSMCLPGIFDPVEYRGKLYVDGGVWDNYIMDIHPPGETFGFFFQSIKGIQSPSSKLSMSSISCMLNVFRILQSRNSHLKFDALHPEHKQRSIPIYIKEKDNHHIPSFVASESKINYYVRMGYNSVAWFFHPQEYMLLILFSSLIEHRKWISTYNEIEGSKSLSSSSSSSNKGNH